MEEIIFLFVLALVHLVLHFAEMFFRSALFSSFAAAIADFLIPAWLRNLLWDNKLKKPQLAPGKKHSGDFDHYEGEAGYRKKTFRPSYCLGNCDLIRLHKQIPNAPPAAETKQKKHRCDQGTTRHFAEQWFDLPLGTILQDNLEWDLRAYYRCHDLPESYVHNWNSTTPIRPVRERNFTSPYLVRSAIKHPRSHAYRNLGTPYGQLLDDRVKIGIRRAYQPISLRELPDLHSK